MLCIAFDEEYAKKYARKLGRPSTWRTITFEGTVRTAEHTNAEGHRLLTIFFPADDEYDGGEFDVNVRDVKLAGVPKVEEKENKERALRARIGSRRIPTKILLNKYPQFGFDPPLGIPHNIARAIRAHGDDGMKDFDFRVHHR